MITVGRLTSELFSSAKKRATMKFCKAFLACFSAASLLGFSMSGQAFSADKAPAGKASADKASPNKPNPLSPGETAKPTAPDRSRTLGGVAPAKSDTFVISYPNDPDTINPIIANDNVSRDFLRWVYEPLA